LYEEFELGVTDIRKQIDPDSFD
jgi:hypothetical protein